MPRRLRLQIQRQPDDTTCGPTCLHAIYRYWGDDISLEDTIAQVRRLDHGGTLAVFLGCHALERGYRATVHTYNLQVWDPSWFTSGASLPAKLRAQLRHKSHEPIRALTEGYLRFIKLGGRVLMEDLTPALIRRYLHRRVPILAGLSGTYLYGTPRERATEDGVVVEDDVRGGPMGHFVVISGYDRRRRRVVVADPLHPNPPYHSHEYRVEIGRLVGAILLGILTYDATMLVIEACDRRPPGPLALRRRSPRRRVRRDAP